MRYQVSDTVVDSSTVDSLVESGYARAWTVPGTDTVRYYLDFELAMDSLNVQIDYYRSGNVRNCTLDGIGVTHSKAPSRSNKFYIEDNHVYTDWILNMLVDNMAECLAVSLNKKVA